MPQLRDSIETAASLEEEKENQLQALERQKVERKTRNWRYVKEQRKKLEDLMDCMSTAEEEKRTFDASEAWVTSKRIWMEIPVNEEEQVNPETHLKEFMCTICMDYMVGAKSYSCGHAFCQSCIWKWFLWDKRCPCCRKMIWNEEPQDCWIIDSTISIILKKERDYIKS